MESTTPEKLNSGGRSLWESIVAEHDLDSTQLVQLEEACRAKDRCDWLDSILQEGGENWPQVLTQANATANLMKQLLAALRLPDPQSGKKPQYRGARGAVKPQVPGGKVSSLDRARAAKSS